MFTCKLLPTIVILICFNEQLVKAFHSTVLKSSPLTLPLTSTTKLMLKAHKDKDKDKLNDSNINHQTRREIMKSMQAVTLSSILTLSPSITNAAETDKMAMTLYEDPNGLFKIRIPKGFFIFRRPGNPTNKDKTKSRKGSSIFTSGDIGKAEIVSVDRFTTASFLEEEGGVRIVDKTIDDLSSFDKIGNTQTIANYIILRRNKEQQQINTNALAKPENITLSPDNKTLIFEYSTRINVQKPDLLKEQIGVDELFRITLVKIDLHSNDGFMNVCYASALQTEFYTEDGVLLRDAVDSFEVFEQVSN